MDTKRKIGQLMVFGFHGKTVSPEIKRMIHEHQVGAIILFARNVGSPAELHSLTSSLQLEAKKAGHEQPLLICLDQENGVVRRLGKGTTFLPGAMLLGATKNPDYAYEVGKATGAELKALGVNWNLAPTVDINNNANNPVIGVRSFGETAESVSTFGQEIIKGMQQAGMITTLKHFPGHGDTSVDSHFDLPVIEHDMERLQSVELKPFIECIQKGADTVMSAHVYFPAIESEEGVPATLSHKVINGLLREQLGFQGVVTTDSMEMKAIADTIGTPQGAVKAINAGVDLIMVSHTYDIQLQSLQAVMEAVEQGVISQETLDQAVNRVKALKGKYLSWENTSTDPDGEVPLWVGGEEHQQLAETVYRSGVTIARNDNGRIPLKNDEKKVLVVYPTNNAIMGVEDKKYATFSLGDSVKSIHSQTEVYEVSNPPTDQEIDRVLELAGSSDTVVVGTLSATNENRQVQLVEALLAAGHDPIVIATRSPYDLAYFPAVGTYMCTYEFTPRALDMAAKALFGSEKPSGELPITIPGLTLKGVTTGGQ